MAEREGRMPTQATIELAEEAFPHVWGWDNTGIRLERLDYDKAPNWREQLAATIDPQFFPIAEVGLAAIYRAMEASKPDDMAQIGQTMSLVTDEKPFANHALFSRIVNQRMERPRPDDLWMHGSSIIAATYAATALKEHGARQETQTETGQPIDMYSLGIPQDVQDKYSGFPVGMSAQSVQLAIPRDSANFSLIASIGISPRLTSPGFPLERKPPYSALMHAEVRLIPTSKPYQPPSPDLDLRIDETIQQSSYGTKTRFQPRYDQSRLLALPKLAGLTFFALRHRKTRV